MRSRREMLDCATPQSEARLADLFISGGLLFAEKAMDAVRGIIVHAAENRWAEIDGGPPELQLGSQQTGYRLHCAVFS